MIFRVILYTDMKFLHYVETDITSSTEVPFYISEILISLTIAYILVSVSKLSEKTSSFHTEESDDAANRFVVYDNSDKSRDESNKDKIKIKHS